jgi:hypothetical protein
VLDFKGNHFAQAEADDGDSFRGFGGKGIKVEDEDADERVGKDDGNGSGAGRDFIEGGADGAVTLRARAGWALQCSGTMAPGGSGTKA